MWLTICLVIVASLAILIYSKKRHKQPTPFQKLALPRQEPSPQLKNKLINAVGAERAEKLVARARFSDPGKTEAYYWWKAVERINRRE
ncbi:hypothetical protein [Coleofasciculus chthonoplastes]|uniref:hypothetical protein n=1 Tax=Coleofasciculus chthonoplastes TaxID=64178 RepID=UPI0032FDB598